jgi:hypothetical protein
VPALYLGTRWGIGGVALASALVAAVLVVPALAVALSRIGVSPTSLLSAAARPAIGGAAMGLACWVTLSVAGDGLLGLVIAGAVALAVYAPFAMPLLRFARLGRRGEPDQAADDAEPAAGQVAIARQPTEPVVGRHRREEPQPRQEPSHSSGEIAVDGG